MDSKETRIVETDKERTPGAGVMDEVKQRLEELQELLEENYITESEYAAARTNVLLEVGVDIVVRPRAEQKRMSRLEARSRRAGAGRDYGRFLIPALLVAGVLACAVFLFWMLAEGGLFAPRRNAPSPSLLPLPSAAPVGSALPDAGGLDEERELEDDGILDVLGELGELGVLSSASEDAEPASEDSVGSILPETSVLSPGAKETAEAPGLPAGESEETVSDEKSALGWAVVSVPRVRIRAAPDVSADNVLGWAYKGERFAVLKEGPGRDGSKWYNVRYEKIGKEGWIKASMMEFGD
jgi:hypothetical protein